jgi:hypothetical protein
LRKLRKAFRAWSRLSSITIPASVEAIAKDCFDECTKLSIVTFEAGSKRSKIAPSAFGRGPELNAIYGPRSIDPLVASFEEFANVTDGAEEGETVTRKRLGQ